MGNTLIILLSYILNFALIIVIISLLLRIRQVERKLINFSPTEAYAIMENMREMIIESERLAHSLESSIKEREAVLEDLSDLVDEKLARFSNIQKGGGNVIQHPQKDKNDSLQISSQSIEIPKQQEPLDKDTKAKSASVKTPNEKDIKAKIVELHQMGKSDAEIARELSISVTEVRLAVSLIK